MIVCVCNRVSSSVIESCLKEKEIKTLEQLQEEIKVCDQCRCCQYAIKDIIIESLSEKDLFEV